MFFKRLLMGVAIGVGCIVPGFSGGVLASLMGVYQPIIDTLAHPKTQMKTNLPLLAPLAIGGGIGVLLLANGIEWLLGNFPNQTTAAFVGLIVGTLPSMVRLMPDKGIKSVKGWVAFLVALLSIFAMRHLPFQLSGADAGVFWMLPFGAVYCFGTVVPGVSATAIFLSIGCYDRVLHAISSLQMPELPLLCAGFLIVLYPLARLISFLFARIPAGTNMAIFGLAAGSIFSAMLKVDFISAGPAPVLLFLICALSVFLVTGPKNKPQR